MLTDAFGVPPGQALADLAGGAAGNPSLTGTEQAVAGLVAEGLNNKQVAARMYISTHTVARHLRQAFRKLSIASRNELTRIVMEQAADCSLALIVPRRGRRYEPRNSSVSDPWSELVAYLPAETSLMSG